MATPDHPVIKEVSQGLHCAAGDALLRGQPVDATRREADVTIATGVSRERNPERAVHVHEISMHTATSARLYDLLGGGCQAYAVDRNLAARALAVAPWLSWSAHTAREYAHTAVSRILDDTDIRQFLDLGCGLPAADGRPLVELVRKTARPDPGRSPRYRYVSVDHDPMVIAHVKCEIVETSGDDAMLLDITSTTALLDALQMFDRMRPVAVLLHQVLEWIPDDNAVASLLTAIRTWLPAGSALSIVHATADTQPDQTAQLVGTLADAGLGFRPRSRVQIAGLFGDFTHIAPGLSETHSWHSGPPTAARNCSSGYAGLAFKPADGPDDTVAAPRAGQAGRRSVQRPASAACGRPDVGVAYWSTRQP
ncbi:SAM-dependent methyltransferase [Streptomyces goshikiensis]|uniref:SAM-dependent methyltransferase n=1 Tax=Streptomyces goshikiensis TaxID=1942 RepID=UPI003675FC66